MPYEAELVMLKKLPYTKGKSLNDFSYDFKGKSDLDGPSESYGDYCEYLLGPEPDAKNNKKV